MFNYIVLGFIMTFSSFLFPATPALVYLSLSLLLSGFLVPCALFLQFPEGLFPLSGSPFHSLSQYTPLT